jgi:mannose-6-phosphate isomerase-like protein (cupin superfamily)
MQIKYNTNEIGGEVIKDNETYVLRDNKTLKNLILSQTILHRNQSTRGHNHTGQEEVYFFVHGKGTMQVGDQNLEVTTGDIVLIPDGDFHRVTNTGESDLVFNCVFDGKRNH